MTVYSIAAGLFLLGVALNISGFMDIGTLLIGLGIVMACSKALKLGHLKR